MTLLIVSVFAETVEEAARQSAEAWAKGADAVELRIDRFRDPLAALADFLREHGDRRWIVTCRGVAEGGLCRDDAAQRARRIAEAVKDTQAMMDVELADWRRCDAVKNSLQEAMEAVPARPHLILSVHDLSGPPADVRALADEVARCSPSAVAKVAYHARHITDSFAALDLIHERQAGAAAVCMDEDGAWTRVLAKKFGAFGSYAALSTEAATAPGQWTIDELTRDYRWHDIGADTRVFGVVGDPVAHSLSPALFNRWFSEAHIDAVYLPLRVRACEGALSQFFDECSRRPWLDVSGFSVTIPHKAAALQWVGGGADPMSIGIGAVNTICLGPGEAKGYNTDCYAAVSSLTAALNCRRSDLAGLTVDVLGAGGVAAAVVFGLSEFGCRSTVYARSATARKAMADRFGCECRPWEERVRRSAEVLINCTAVGMWPDVDRTPLPPESLHGYRLVFDLIYKPNATQLLSDAAAVGCRTLNGLEMFVRQAATQFELWTGRTPDVAAARAYLESNSKQPEAAPQRLPDDRAGNRRCIALIGMRGSGKTSVGRALAARLGAQCIDTDELIVKATGRSIAELFATEGEAGFRRRESAVIQRTASSPPTVLSVGGGAIEDDANVERLRSFATIVWLTAPTDVLRQRIAADPQTTSSRPSLTTAGTLDEVDRTLSVREPLYRAAADFVIDTAGLDPAEIALRILDQMGLKRP